MSGHEESAVLNNFLFAVVASPPCSYPVRYVLKRIHSFVGRPGALLPALEFVLTHSFCLVVQERKERQHPIKWFFSATCQQEGMRSNPYITDGTILRLLNILPWASQWAQRWNHWTEDWKHRQRIVLSIRRQIVPSTQFSRRCWIDRRIIKSLTN